MGTAKQPGGLYFVGETAVDAHGNELKDAPKKSADTLPSEQPGAIGSTSTPEERMASAIASALRPSARAVAPATVAVAAVPAKKKSKK